MRRLGASGLAVPRAVVAAVADVAGAVVGAVAPAHLSGAVVGAVAGEGHGGSGNCEGEEDAGGGCDLVELHGEPPVVGEKLRPQSRRLGPGRNRTMVLGPGGDAVVARPQRRLHPIGDADLAVDARQVRLDGLLADPETP